MIKIVAIGKKHEAWVEPGVKRYLERLHGAFSVEWVLLPHSQFDGDRARQDESGAILTRLSPTDYVVLLDERGKNLSSPELSDVISRAQTDAKQLVFIIGGAYGVHDSVHMRAQVIWSLSNLVFPHQLVRLLLAEQLYRSQSIASGHPYHHD